MIVSIGSGLILLPILILYLNHIPIGQGLLNDSRQTDLVWQQSKGQEEDLIEEEALIGILAKEVPYTYEIEALKAQAIVERTYMARRLLGLEDKGAIIGYTEEEMRQLWGDNYDKIHAIYEKAVEETRQILILYNKQPIEAIYHRASSGKTRSALSVYHTEVPYLQSVETKEDQINTQLTYTKSEVVHRILDQYTNLAVDEKHLEDQIQIVAKDEAQYIIALQIGNITMTGEEVQKLFNLPSCSFKIYANQDKIIFDVKGIGNGVGLSQNGANELAKQGESYEEIIHHYYKDVTVEKYVFQK